MSKDVLIGQASECSIVSASADDLTMIAQQTGQEYSADDVCIVEAVAYDTTTNKNGWRVQDPSGVECCDGCLTKDHSTKAADSFGVVFAERIENDRKIVKAAIAKTPAHADDIADIKLGVLKFTSPMIEVAQWADEKARVVAKAKLIHLSFTQKPAYGTDNKVISVAAESEAPVILDAETRAYAALGRAVHAENVVSATRFAERKYGPFDAKTRDEYKAKYASMAPELLAADVLPLLKETANLREPQTTSQKTLSAQTPESVGNVRKPLYPLFNNERKE